MKPDRIEFQLGVERIKHLNDAFLAIADSCIKGIRCVEQAGFQRGDVAQLTVINNRIQHINEVAQVLANEMRSIQHSVKEQIAEVNKYVEKGPPPSMQNPHLN